MIEMIWAMDENKLVGRDLKMPWHYPKDLAYFKEHTHGKTVLMGSKTYESLKGYYEGRALPFKKIYVATSKEITAKNVETVKDVVNFIKKTKENIIITGGSTIYGLCFPYADRLRITYILNRHQGNVYFPKYDLSDFKLIEKELDDQLIFAYYERIK
ncbi:MAG: dihydrofolate reductase [Acholeplasmataceae bacterium]